MGADCGVALALEIAIGGAIQSRGLFLQVGGPLDGESGRLALGHIFRKLESDSFLLVVVGRSLHLPALFADFDGGLMVELQITLMHFDLLGRLLHLNLNRHLAVKLALLQVGSNRQIVVNRTNVSRKKLTKKNEFFFSLFFFFKKKTFELSSSAMFDAVS